MSKFQNGILLHEYVDDYFCVDRLRRCSVHVFLVFDPMNTEEPSYEVLVALYIQPEAVVISRLFFQSENEATNKFRHLLAFYNLK